MTNSEFIVNHVNAAEDYQAHPSDFIIADLLPGQDYLIWSEGSAVVADGQPEPTQTDLIKAAPIISLTSYVKVSKCFILDKSDNGGTMREIVGMGGNYQYAFGFSFDGDTSSEPQLEAWDTSAHTTTNFHVLGNGTPANSMIRAICTTLTAPGVGWTGSALAGASNVLLLNNGNGALSPLVSPFLTQELYFNLQIIIPQSYPDAAVEPFILTMRYTWN